MTEGTSQGLFLVVAIVIFGIFVGLSYLIFGDTLKPAVVNLFTDATEQATSDLNKENVKLVDNYEDTIFKYTFNTANNTASIMGYTSGKEVPELIIPESIVNEGVEYSVTSIGYFAFSNLEIITKVSIPNTVTEIGRNAFANNKLTNVKIPDSVTSIGNSAFYDNLLTSVELPSSINTISKSAFQGNSLTSVEIPNSVKTIGDDAFQSNKLTSVTIGNSITSIGYRAFGYNKLTSVEIPDSVTTIGEYAFYTNLLTSVVIPDSVTTIGTGAFTENTALKTVELPYGFTPLENTFQSGATITNRTN